MFINQITKLFKSFSSSDTLSLYKKLAGNHIVKPLYGPRRVNTEHNPPLQLSYEYTSGYCSCWWRHINTDESIRLATPSGFPDRMKCEICRLSCALLCRAVQSNANPLSKPSWISKPNLRINVTIFSTALEQARYLKMDIKCLSKSWSLSLASTVFCLSDIPCAYPLLPLRLNTSRYWFHTLSFPYPTNSLSSIGGPVATALGT